MSPTVKLLRSAANYLLAEAHNDDLHLRRLAITGPHDSSNAILNTSNESKSLYQLYEKPVTVQQS